ncbi:uncharacterized protein [Haliotis asinina]|uniref:uncharacterized protein n=1 Tax=Haliotis asinina TaxID=109174 RepID=UPI003532216D
MSSYKLLYFNGRGRGEVIRLLFTLKGQEFEDKRVTQETWPAEKPNTPFGQIPVLTIDGKPYTESQAIAKFLAKEFGFYGSNNQEEYEIDRVIGICGDLFQELVKEFFEQDSERKAKIQQNLKEKTKPKIVENLEKILSAKGNGYCVGESLTLGDLVLFDTLDGRIDDDILDKNPNVKAVINNVRSNDRIRTYLSARAPSAIYYKAMGELPRLLFTLAGQEFEDVGITYDQWPAETPNNDFQLVRITVASLAFTDNTHVTQHFLRAGVSSELTVEDSRSEYSQGNFTMPTYKFSYFNVRAFGELSRLLFVLAGQEFEDNRVDREVWPSLKSKTPLGQLPVLEIDGTAYPQSNAIFRYLAKIFGFYGNSDLEALEMDQVLGVIQDVYMAYMQTVFEKDEAVKAEKMKDLKEVKVPLYFGMLEKLLKKNGSTGYFVGKKLSLADVSVFDVADKMSSVVKLEDFPLVKKCSDIVLANPRIKAYLEKRPVTEM